MHPLRDGGVNGGLGGQNAHANECAGSITKGGRSPRPACVCVRCVGRVFLFPFIFSGKKTSTHKSQYAAVDSCADALLGTVAVAHVHLPIACRECEKRYECKQQLEFAMCTCQSKWSDSTCAYSSSARRGKTVAAPSAEISQRATLCCSTHNPAPLEREWCALPAVMLIVDIDCFVKFFTNQYVPAYNVHCCTGTCQRS